MHKPNQKKEEEKNSVEFIVYMNEDVFVAGIKTEPLTLDTCVRNTKSNDNTLI